MRWLWGTSTGEHDITRVGFASKLFWQSSDVNLIEAGTVFDRADQLHAVEVVNLDAFNCPNSAEFFVWKRFKTERPRAYVDGFLLAAPLLRLMGGP